MKALAIYAAVFAVLAAVVAFGLRGVAPPRGGREESEAFAAVNDKMMRAMMGHDVVYSGNTDGDFVMLMVPHHQGAVDMAEVELKYGTDPEIRALAKRIADAQVPQIHQMSRWKQGRALTPAPDMDAEREGFTAANNTMMNGMMGGGIGHSGNADLDFVQMMIPHHQGAVDMGKVELRFGQDPELRKLAEDIIAVQEREIAEMNRWLRAHGH